MPVGLVEAEDETARDAVAVEQSLELLEAADHPVDVAAEMRVRVEDVGTGRQLGAQLRLEVGEELFGACQWLAHPRNLPRRGI